ncbi:MAG: MFS transporter, partial [Pseudomonadota bacterium]
GYVAGILSLVLVLGFLAPAPGGEKTLLGLFPAFGLDPSQGEPQRATGPLAALWFVLFAVPLFLVVPDAPRRANPGSAVRSGLAALTASIKSLPGERSLFAFLIGSMLYRDALAGVYIFGGIYAAGVLGWGTFQLGVFGIIAALVAALGAWLGGRADRAFGPKPVVLVSVCALILVCIVTLSTNRTSVLGMAVDAGSQLPDITFNICGALIGGFGGALQAASRTLLVFQADGRMSITQAFGLYALSGKATAFLAPLLIGVVTTMSGSQAWGITPVIGLFALSLLLLRYVHQVKV